MMKNVVKSGDLSRYKLTKALKSVLERQQQLDDYMTKAGHKQLPYIRLYQHDYVKIDSAIRSESEGAFDITKVLFGGRKLINQNAPEPSFQLDTQS